MRTEEYDIVTEAEEQFTLEYNKNGIKFYTNNSMVYCEINGNFNIPQLNSWINLLDINNPKLMNGVANGVSAYDINVKFMMMGNKLQVASTGTTGNKGIVCSFMYPRGDKTNR